MDPNNNKTFIPHNDTSTGNSRIGNLFFFVSLFLFIASIIFAGIAFVMRKNAEKSLISYQETLSNSEKKFKEGLPVHTIQELDKRIRATKDILNKHKSFTGFFSLLERITLKNVQFTKLSYNSENLNKANSVTIIGRASDYKTIAEQSEQFSRDEEARRYLTDVIFSNLIVDTKDTGLISFEINFNVDEEFLSYNKYIIKQDITGVNNINSPRDAVPKVKSQ